VNILTFESRSLMCESRFNYTATIIHVTSHTLMRRFRNC